MSVRRSVGKVTKIDAGGDAVTWGTESTAASGEAAARRVSVELNDGEVYALPTEDPRHDIWVQFLESRRQSGWPVYVESDEAGQVQAVLAPIRQVVEAVAPEAEGGQRRVILFTSATTFSVSEERKELAEVLEESARTGRLLLITADPDSHEILDARAADGGAQPEHSSNGPITEEAAAELFENITFTLLGAAISEAQMTEEFTFLSGQARIPFNYPDDCCKARAHEMCRLMRDHGISARKIWNYGRGWINQTPLNRTATLRANTPHHPDGFVLWLYHVAPVVLVRADTGLTRDVVIDPALFGRHVTVDAWLDAQNDPASFFEITDDVFYWRNIGNLDAQLDPDFAFTRESLDKHRLNGNLRAIKMGHPVIP